MSTDTNLDDDDFDVRKTAVIDTELHSRKVDIAALQETRLSGTGSIKERNYTLYWFGRPEGQVRLYGTGFAVHNSLVNSIQTPQPLSERISHLRLFTAQGTIMVISAYAPTLKADSADKDAFYEDLEELVRSAGAKDRIVLLGDMNARVGDDHESWNGCLGRFGVGKMNENGQRLLELCSRQSLSITNSLFPGRAHRKMSWCHPRSKQWHQLDFVIVRQCHRTEVCNTRSYHSADCDSDHSLVLSSMKLQPKPYYCNKKQTAKIDVNRSHIPDLREEYCDFLTLQLSDEKFSTSSNPEDLWNNLKNVIHSTGLRCFGKRKRKDPDWYTASLETMEPVVEKKRQALLRMKSRPTRSAQNELRACRADAQRTARKCAKIYWDSLCSRIEKARDQGNTKEMYSAIKEATGPVSQSCSVLKHRDGSVITDNSEKLDRWIEHYSELYTGESTVCAETLQSLPCELPQTSLDKCPELDEVIATVMNLRCNKAAGEDAIPGELLKAGIPALAVPLHRLVTSCWSTGTVPQEFKDAKITTLYKQKGDRGDCNNYRGISLLSVTGKVIAKLVLNRLQKLAEDLYPESQCGFRPCRSTTDMIFCVRQLMEKSREQRQPLHLAFIDLTKAFDLVDRDSLFTILSKSGCPPTLLSLIKSFHSGMRGKVQFDGDISDSFPVNRGVKQGCVLAPTLFGIYFAYVFRVAFANVSNRAGVSLLLRDDGNFFSLARFRAKSRVEECIVREFLYADDAAICATSASHLQELLDGFSSACQKFGLTISLKKTVTLSINQRHDFHINETTLQNVDSFTYLGSTMTSNLCLDKELSTRLGRASAVFGELGKRVWRNKHLTTATKIRVYEACVVSILLYGSPSWTTYRRQEDRLSAFHTRNLRAILGVTWKDKMTNENLFNITRSRPLSSQLKFNRLRWAGHVHRMTRGRLPHTLLHSVLKEGTRPIGRPRLRYKDVLKRDLRDFNINTTTWTSTCSDRVMWRYKLHEGMKSDKAANLEKLKRRRDRLSTCDA
jgi:hypothetical protein